jgi:hypothetical protein
MIKSKYVRMLETQRHALANSGTHADEHRYGCTFLTLRREMQERCSTREPLRKEHGAARKLLCTINLLKRELCKLHDPARAVLGKNTALKLIKLLSKILKTNKAP